MTDINLNPIYLEGGTTALEQYINNTDIADLIPIIKFNCPDSTRKIYKCKDKDKIKNYIINRVVNNPLNNWNVWQTARD